MAEPGTRVVEPHLPPASVLKEGVPEPSLGRIRWLFIASLLAGALLAGAGIARSGQDSSALPPGVVARVGNAAIPRAEYERTLLALARDRKTPLSPEDRGRALDRLIDEELLLQRALDLDLPRSDLRARRALIGALVDSIVVAEDAVEPTETELRRFYQANKDWFLGAELLHVEQIWFRADTPEEAAAAERRARAAYDRIVAGEPFEQVKAASGDPESPPLPAALLPASKLGELLGPTVLRTVLELPPNGVSSPVRSATGYHIVRVVERRQGEPPPFEEIRPQVLNEFRRRAADQALRNYLDELRAHARIVLAPDLATGSPPATPDRP